ncbi:MAG: hypothetical protein EP334_03850 [Gammaproteobacteria bacterium]|nr:MAG: hypothetical protein EP334_03850 [Gammaproteobacteria bacterium]
MEYIIVPLGTMIFLSGCAIDYQPPSNEASYYSGPHKSNQKEVVARTKRALVEEGFQILSSDDTAGVISTTAKRWKLEPWEANCGKIMDLNYLLDPRTTTDVAFDIRVDATTLTIHSSIQGKFKPSAVDESVPLTCVSNYGVLEQHLAAKILE